MSQINDEYIKFISKLNKYEIDQFGSDPSACWLFAYFIHHTYGLDVDDDNEPKYNTFTDLLTLIEIIVSSGYDRIYSVYLEHSEEFHHFILIRTEMNIRMLATYDGQSGIIDITYTIEEFNERATALCRTGNVAAAYKLLFGIKKLSYKQVNLSKCNIKYTVKNGSI